METVISRAFCPGTMEKQSVELAEEQGEMLTVASSNASSGGFDS